MESREAYGKKFGKRLREIREEKGISLRELALEMHSDKPTLSKIENGQMVPSVYYLKRICVALKMMEVEFYSGMR